MTTFTAPLKTQGANNPTGNPQTDTSGFVETTKQIVLGPGADSRKVVTIPDKSTLISCFACATSAFASDVSACNVSFGNSADATHYGVISVSAIGQQRFATVSAADEFDASNTVVITLSAVSTTTFTTGGARAFIRYLTVE